jgi:hypothetical protein
MKVRYVLLGVITPVLCLALDGFVFKGAIVGLTYGAFLGYVRVFVWLVAGLGIALFLCQNLVKPLARYVCLWAPCFVLGGAGALLIALPLLVLDAYVLVSALGWFINDILINPRTRDAFMHLSLKDQLSQGRDLIGVIFGSMAWASALLFLRTGLRSVKGSFWPVWRVLPVLAFGLAVFGVPALVNNAAMDFINRRVDVILTGTREEAVASAYSLKAAFWCDASCLHRLSSAYDDADRKLYPATQADARWALVAECFRIVTGLDIRDFHQMGI